MPSQGPVKSDTYLGSQSLDISVVEQILGEELDGVVGLSLVGLGQCLAQDQ